MRKNVCFLAVFILLLIPAVLKPRIRREIRIPDIEGYQTLIGDFHIHTLLSDGDVWPTVRVEEAFREGLDVIALSDHVETDYRSQGQDIPVRYNRTYELALPRARELGILLIRAAEITRDMSPGHFNALFISDETPLTENDPFKAIELAVKQGAFIIWNHPGWAAQLKEDGVVRWYPEHTRLLEKGWLKGIEVVNWDEYYPEVFKWVLEKKLTLFGNSDSHTRVDYKFEPAKAQHRPYTLVFTRARTLEGVREALVRGRTLVYHRHLILGREEWLAPFFERCVELVDPELSSNEAGRALIRICNHSDIPVMIKTNADSEDFTLTPELHILPHTTDILTLVFKKQSKPGLHELNIPVTVTNFLKNPDQGLAHHFKLTLTNNRSDIK